jgi:hypothetical protein
VTGDRELDHCEPMRRGGDRRRTMRRVAGGNEAHGGEFERGPQLTGELQVAAMDWVEGTAEDAEHGMHHQVDCSLQRSPDGF